MRGLAAAVVVVVAIACPAHADEAADKKQAKAHYKQGIEFQNEGQHLAAVDEFKKAYDLTKKPELLYNIARAYQLGGDRKAAIDYYGRFLAEVPEGDVADEARQFVAQLTRELREEEQAKAEEARKQEEARKAEEAERERERQEAERKQREQQAAAAPPVTPPVAGSAIQPPAASVAAPARHRLLRVGWTVGLGQSSLPKVPDVIESGSVSIGGPRIQLSGELQVWPARVLVLRIGVAFVSQTGRFEHCAPCVETGDYQFKAAALTLAPGVAPWAGARVDPLLYGGISGLYGLSADYHTAGDGETPLDFDGELELLGGLAFRIRIGDRHVLVDARFTFGLTGLFSDDNHWTSIGVHLGYAWGL